MDMIDIQKKQEKLEKVKNILKNNFVGLDNIIDNIFSTLEVWYIMPEILTRPIIINLWGMTGVGKTDLVRQITKYLGFKDKYLEIQLDTSKNSWGDDSIYREIKSSGILPEESSILLLDEIQRFRSIDENGKMVENSKFQDIWMLLSDGCFSNSFDRKKKIYKEMLHLLYYIDVEDNNEDTTKKDIIYEEGDNKSSNKNRKYKTQIWVAEDMKNLLHVENSIEEIMSWDNIQKLKVIKEKLNDMGDDNQDRYSKMLIFISGNLDEAYSMSNQVSEINIDADILHEFSKNIDILKIKKSLLQKFKPEQIARMGNNHIIYPSLSSKNFKDLISKYLSNIKHEIKKNTGIDISYDESISKMIYENGVYPSQGVRPLYSTISMLIENTLPYFIYNSILKNTKEFLLYAGDNKIYTYICNEYYDKYVRMDLKNIKDSISENQMSCVTIHEVGHAVAYAVLFKICPLQICNNGISGADGFTMPHFLYGSYNNLLNQVKVLLAGIVAEEIIFGDTLKTDGATSDISSATSLVSSIVRIYGMSSYNGKILPITHDNAKVSMTNIEDTNILINNILSIQKKEVEKILRDNLKLLKVIAKELYERKNMDNVQFYNLAVNYLDDISIQDSSFKIIDNYKEIFDDFLLN